MCKSTVKPGSPQMTIWSMHVAWWVPNATNTHTDYAILIDFHCNKCRTNAPQCYVIRTLAVLFFLGWVRPVAFANGAKKKAVNEGMLLNYVLNKQDSILWTISMWLRTGAWQHSNESANSIKRGGIHYCLSRYLLRKMALPYRVMYCHALRRSVVVLDCSPIYA